MDVIIVINAAISLTLKLINTFIHIIGLYLLRYLQRNGSEDVQMIYVINLSATELIINITSFLRNLLKLLPLSVFKSNEFKEILNYSYIVDYTILKFCLYMTMFVITLDRMFLILLNVFYPVHWNIRRAKLLVGSMWLFGFLMFIATTVMYTLNKDAYLVSLFANYVTITLDVAFVITAVASYTLIFMIFVYNIKFRERHTNKNPSNSESHNQQNIFQTFRQSRFYMPLLLIFTFIMFVIPADAVWTFYSLKNKNRVVS